MPKSIPVVRKKRGRPPTGQDPVTAVRLSPVLKSQIEDWAKQQPDNPSRSEAIRGDSAAALVRDGKLVAAAEEERFRRVKHWAGFPSKAIAYCLREAGLALSDVEHVAVNQDSRANFLRKLAYLVTQRPNLGLM